MNKKIYNYKEIEDKILHAVDTINDPVAQTLSPKGGNVVYVDDKGDVRYTNDGFTIVSNMFVKDEVENAIIEIIKTGSMKTNLEAGDNTSSTVVMSSILIKEGLRLIRDGVNQMDLRDELIKFALDLRKELEKRVKLVKSDSDLKKIAQISANNDKDIAEDIVKVIKIVNLDGQVMINGGFDEKTEIIEDTGFVIKSGIFAQELADSEFKAMMLDVPVLITDKRLYYKEEAEKILSTILDAGYNEVVIVAQDFIGEALPYFVANHKNGKVRVMLVAEKKLELMEDLATYLGTEVISDKKGSLVDDVNISQFALAKKIFSNAVKTIVSRDKKESTKAIDKRVKALKGLMKKNGNKNDPEYRRLEDRVSALTNGMVTIKVGGSTPLEIREKMNRYEDAINAARVALKEGFLPGGGISVYNAFKNIKVKPKFERMFRAAAEVNIRQIATNCGKIPDLILNAIDEKNYYAGFKGGNFGYNADTGKIEDMIQAGVIEPLFATKQVIANAVSIANIILTSRYLIVNDIEENK